MVDVTQRAEKERLHAGRFIDWVEAAIYAVEKGDYQACRAALDVARKHLDLAEENVKPEH